MRMPCFLRQRQMGPTRYLEVVLTASTCIGLTGPDLISKPEFWYRSVAEHHQSCHTLDCLEQSANNARERAPISR